MVSPDWSTYIDLTPNDASVTSILEDSLTQARALLPSWTPRAGEIETTLLEATAYQTANLANAANRVPGAVVETLLKLHDVARSDGTKATATVAITFSDSLGHTVPAGTPVAHFGIGGSVYVYLVDVDSTVAVGSSSLAGVAVTAQAVGIGYNTPSNGSAVQVLATIPFIQSVTLDSKPAGGFDSETDTEFFARATTLLKSYSSALTTADQLSSYVLANYTGTVYRAKAYNTSRFSDRDVITGGLTHDGYVLLSVAGQNINGYTRSVEDATVSSANIATISTAVAAKTPAGVVVEIHNAELFGVGVTCEAYKISTAASGTVSTAIQTALDTYLDADAWNWGRVVRKNEIVSLIDGVTGVDYVRSVTLSLPEETVRVATTAAGTLVSSFENGDDVDGVTLATGDRILIKDQSTASENGIYTVNASGAPTRATDADTTNEMVVDKFVWVTAGTDNGSKGFSCSAAGTLGTDSVKFQQTTTAVRAEVMASDETGGVGALTGDIRANRLGMLPYPSTMTITVS